MTRSTWPGRQHAIGVAVAAVARQPHRLLDPAEGLRGRLRFISSGLVVNRTASASAAQRAHPQLALAGRTAIARRAAVAGEALAGERLMHHAEDRLARPRQRDQRAPGRHAGR